MEYPILAPVVALVAWTLVMMIWLYAVRFPALARKGISPDAGRSKAQFDQITSMFEAQADAFYTSGLMLDDGVIDPRDTRSVLAFCLDTIAEAERKQLRPMQFGVARM